MSEQRPKRQARRTLAERKRIALVAHDGKKDEMLAWAMRWRDELSRHQLLGTGTTARRISKELGLEVEGLMSGPLGGDQQIGARIAEGNLDLLIFLWDPFAPMPHDPDVKALLRLAALWNVPVANNVASADFMFHSSLMSESVEIAVPDANDWVSTRA
ncbi:methylglyoxal synthase [Cobetia marina]|uniref:methylglyoxal synthase n=1 Tax=Cobetia marina TaxID=28258 RepID=UPI00174CA050